MLSNEQRSLRVDKAHTSHQIINEKTLNTAMPEFTHEHQQGSNYYSKPSRLELMRRDYQKRLLKEKEQKLIQIYEDNQKRLMARLTKTGHDDFPKNYSSPSSHHKSVRDFFNERRRMEANGVPMPPTQNLYHLARGTFSTHKLSNSSGSGNSLKTRKANFVGDRHQPLAPILKNDQRVQETTSNVPPISKPQYRAVVNEDEDNNPTSRRSTVEEHEPAFNSYFEDDENDYKSVDPYVTTSGATLQVPQTKKQPHHQIQSSHQPKSVDNIPHFDSPDDDLQTRKDDKLTDFQKWIMNNEKGKDKSIRKHTDNNKFNNITEESRTRKNINTVEENWNTSNGSFSFDSSSYIDEDDSSSNTHKVNNLNKISRRQIVSEKSRKTMEKMKETFQIEQEQKIKQVNEKGRQNKLNEKRNNRENLKQQGSYSFSEDLEDGEEINEREIKEREKKRKTEKKYPTENDKVKEKEKLELKKKENFKMTKQLDHLSSERNNYNKNSGIFEKDSLQRSTKQEVNLYTNSSSSQPSLSKRMMTNSDDSISPVPVTKTDLSNETESSVTNVTKCQVCGRSFLPERLKKHQDVCAKVNKPRKEFDSFKKRVEGTELVKYAEKPGKPETPKKKSNWRAKHDEFVQSLRYARKVTQYEKEGIDLRKLTPPPVSSNPDYVPCPHCGRTFNSTAAERHIPKCQTLKTRPATLTSKHHNSSQFDSASNGYQKNTRK